MGINAISTSQTASVLASSISAKATESVSPTETFKLPAETTKKKLSLSDFYPHGDLSRFTGSERSELKKAVGIHRQDE